MHGRWTGDRSAKNTFQLGWLSAQTGFGCACQNCLALPSLQLIPARETIDGLPLRHGMQSQKAAADMDATRGSIVRTDAFSFAWEKKKEQVERKRYLPFCFTFPLLYFFFFPLFLLFQL
jgi:hypothetical protein